MNQAIFDRVRTLLGSASTGKSGDGIAQAAPDSTDGISATLALAKNEGWRVRIEGRGSWMPPNAPADLVVTSLGLDRVVKFAPADLVATVQAGISVAALERALTEGHAWLPIDAPGRPDRTIGSVIATGTAGPLREGFGPVRDHVLGCTTVTGDGQVVKSGGVVVKNVAGYDLNKLQAGGFGAFGLLTEVNIRLRAVPASDLTLIAQGGRDALTAEARRVIETKIDPGALELLSPAVAADADWVLAVRLIGGAEGVRSRAKQIRHDATVSWTALTGDQASALWHGAARAFLSGATTIRLGVLSESLDEIIDLVAEHLDLGLLSAGTGKGGLRWSGEATVEHLTRLRHVLAAREIPLTLERAEWKLRHAFGHFGAYREGVGAVVSRLRSTFDPGAIFQVPLDGTAVDG